MGIEIELKYKATPELQKAVKASFPGHLRTLSMETVYFDTAGGALSEKHYTLRRRLENGVPVCTVKAPAPAGRGEWEVNCESITDAIPLLSEKGAPGDLAELCAPGLLPVCGAAFTREYAEIEYEGIRAELAFDTGVLTGGGRCLPLCEIEAELKKGNREGLLAFGKMLEKQFGLIPEPYSKFKRALALSKGEGL